MTMAQRLGRHDETTIRFVPASTESVLALIDVRLKLNVLLAVYQQRTDPPAVGRHRADG